MVVKNIVFDIGNVLLSWKPEIIVSQVFPDALNINELTKQMFKSEPWKELNRGLLTMEDLIVLYHKTLNVPLTQLHDLMVKIKDSLTPIPGSLELLKDLCERKIPLYCITDNVHEIMDHLKVKYDFWYCFTGITVSAEIGILKPNLDIYQHLLKMYHLKAEECVFIDDVQANVDGAIALGMKGIVFTDAINCRNHLSHIIGEI